MGELPAWLRRTEGEHRWPSAVAVAVAIGLQMLLPAGTAPQVRWTLVALELAALVTLVAVDPFRVDRESTVLRGLDLVLLALMGTSNVWSLTVLVTYVVEGRPTSPRELLVAGASTWLTNVVVFALYYWEMDRGGPAARAAGRQQHADLLFPQMQDPELDRGWEPQFADYLYLAFTNSTAFSPTDVLPLTRWVKMAMMLQAAVALVVVGLVIARAVNVLGE